MLVCNLVLARRGAVIAVDLTEAVSASDQLGTGNIIATTLIDAPASVVDRVDAYFGQVMAEKANATDSYSVGLLHAVFVDEPAAASDAVAPRAPGAVSAVVAEVVTANDEPSAAMLLIVKSSMVVGPVLVNSGAPRQSNANGTMINS